MNRYLTEFPLEYCAFRFLCQWLRDEQALHHDILPVPSNDVVRRSLAYFGVARNFKGLSEHVPDVRDALQATRFDSTLDAIEKVERLADKFNTRFRKRNISAASKLLWLCERSPFVIYDNRAAHALSAHFGGSFNPGDYRRYVETWRTHYGNLERRIEIAVAKLPAVREFIPSNRPSAGELGILAHEAWFKERVFDIFLWEVGGTARASTCAPSTIR